MDNFVTAVNEMLVEVYHNILRVEEQALKSQKHIPLSINEMHLIECVSAGGPEGATVSELADKLNVTRPSVTVAVNKLELKRCLLRENCPKDGRVVRVHLTPEGKKINNYHTYYHRAMVRDLLTAFDKKEQGDLLRLIGKLNDFFKNSLKSVECKV